MNYLIQEEELPIHYHPGKGAWTYHLQIPNTRQIKARWGHLKVSGTIDGHPVECRNLAPVKNSDKLLSLNSALRKAIGKGGGDLVRVTLYVSGTDESITPEEILDCFRDADLLGKFKSLPASQQRFILDEIRSGAGAEEQEKRILQHIRSLARGVHS